MIVGDLTLVDFGFETPCWVWGGRKNPSGHGRMGRSDLAHRSYYVRLGGRLADQEILHHRCEVPACVNPLHMKIYSDRGSHRRAHRRLHCKRGHALVGDNVYVRPDNGKRQCRACAALRRPRYV